MKIKIRPDESGTPGTPGHSEWTAMNDWLADLREDGEGQAMPESENFTGPDHEGYAEPDRQSYQGTDRQGYAGPDREGFTGPDRQSYAGPDREGFTEPDRQSYAGPDRGGYVTPHGDGHSGPADGREVRRSGEREPWAMTSGPAPAPRHGYMSRARAGTRARTGPPAEATTVRAIIGDELRTPTAWCEMGNCISWHADRSALGEADIRARAIGAGWRIDALGRLACPRCLQTSASFRATRPVVPWDRATAISMAARATARGDRSTRPAGANGFGTQHQASSGTQHQANGRGTRQPAHGRW